MDINIRDVMHRELENLNSSLKEVGKKINSLRKYVDYYKDYNTTIEDRVANSYKLNITSCLAKVEKGIEWVNSMKLDIDKKNLGSEELDELIAKLNIVYDIVTKTKLVTYGLSMKKEEDIKRLIDSLELPTKMIKGLKSKQLRFIKEEKKRGLAG